MSTVYNSANFCGSKRARIGNSGSSTCVSAPAFSPKASSKDRMIRCLLRFLSTSAKIRCFSSSVNRVSMVVMMCIIQKWISFKNVERVNQQTSSVYHKDHFCHYFGHQVDRLKALLI